MAKIYCKSSYLLRKDTAENWGSKNPVLRKGEQGLETDTGIMKIGDGITAFNSLSDDNIYLPKSRINKSVDDVKSYVNNNFSNALKGSKSGSAILIDDVSPVTHEMGVKVRGKNLIPYPYAETQSTINGISVTYGEDGSVIFNGTAASNVYFKVFERVKFPAGKYYLSGTPTDGGAKVAFLYFFETDNPSTTYNAYTTNGVACSLSGTEYSGRIYIAKGQTAENLVFKPQLELGTTATAYTPYVPDLTAVKVTRCGKNLLSNDTVISESATPVNKKIWSGNLPVPCAFSQDVSQFTAPSPSAALFMFKLADGTEKYLAASGNRILFSGVTLKEIYFINRGSGTGTVKCQLEIGSLETDYEPYIGAEYIPTADGTVEGVTSLYPNTSLMTDTDGVIIDCEYNRDINKAFAALEAAIVTNS